MKHLLLCGHGYLGQAISRDFIASGWRVTAVSRDEDASDGDGRLARVSADLSSMESITRLAAGMDSPDFVVHCAASGRGGPEAYRSVYRDGCRHLLEAFPGVPLLFTSSSSVYAQTDGSIVTESSPADPDRETGRILRETEELVLAAQGIVLRLSGIYGPRRSYLLQKFLSGEASVEEDGRRIVNQIHREDAARAVHHAATTPLASGIWNVSDSHPRSQIETYRVLAEIFGRPLPPSAPRDLNRKRGWTNKQVSNGKLFSSGWTPLHPDFLESAPEIAASLDLR